MKPKNTRINEANRRFAAFQSEIKMKEVIHVGFTGPLAAGKGTAIEVLHNSLSNIVREKATEEGVEQTRENLIKVGNSLRKKHGAGVLGLKISEKLNASKYAIEIIDGIRHPDEAKALRTNLKNFVLIAVTAKPAIRYERALSRQRADDVADLSNKKSALAKLQEKDEKDRSIGIDECIRMADYVITNETITPSELQAQVFNSILHYLQKLKSNPT